MHPLHIREFQITLPLLPTKNVGGCICRGHHKLSPNSLNWSTVSLLHDTCTSAIRMANTSRHTKIPQPCPNFSSMLVFHPSCATWMALPCFAPLCPLFFWAHFFNVSAMSSVFVFEPFLVSLSHVIGPNNSSFYSVNKLRHFFLEPPHAYFLEVDSVS